MRVISNDLSDLYEKNSYSPDAPERAPQRKIEKTKSLLQKEMLDRIDKALRDKKKDRLQFTLDELTRDMSK